MKIKGNRFVSSFLSCVMIFSLCTPAFASEESPQLDKTAIYSQLEKQGALDMYDIHEASITFARCSQVMMYINLYSPLYVLSLALIAAAREYPTTISAKFKIRSSTSKLSLTIGCIASTPMSHQY